MLSAKLDRDNAMQGSNAQRRDLTKRLLRARRERVVPLLPNILPGRAKASFEAGLLQARWLTKDRALTLLANISGEQRKVTMPSVDAIVWGERADHLAPWAVFAGIGAA